MKKNIRSKGMELSPELQSQAERRLDFALGRLSESIRAVDVQFTGRSTGKKEQSCQISIRLTRGGRIVLRTWDENLDGALSQAAGLAARQVTRHFARRRRSRHSRALTAA